MWLFRYLFICWILPVLTNWFLTFMYLLITGTPFLDLLAQGGVADNTEGYILAILWVLFHVIYFSKK